MEGRRARRLRAGDVARRDVPTCRLGDRLDEVRTRVRASGWDACIVVNEAGVVLGRLGGAAWTEAGRATVEAVMKTPTTYRPDNLLESLLEVMHRKRAKSLLIIDSDGVLVGVIDRQDAERKVSASPSGRGQRRSGRRGVRARPRAWVAR